MSAETAHGKAAHHIEAPDKEYDVRELFGIDIDMKVMGFSEPSDYVPLSILIINLIKKQHSHLQAFLIIAA